jgi:hypothetical protein
VALRVVGEVLGTVTFLAAIVHLPLANTAAIFQALPLAVTLGAALMFGEPVGWRRWLAIAAGFIGVLIIVRPGVEGFNQFSLFALISVNSQFKRMLTRGQQIIEQNEALSSENTSLEIRNTKLTSRGRELERTLEKRKREVDSARKEVSKATAALDKAQSAVKKLEKDIAKKKRELVDADAKLAATKRALHGVALGRAKFQVESALVRQVGFVLNQGDEVARGTIPGNLKSSELNAELYALLKRASDRAAGLNCKPGENGRAVTVVQRVYNPKTKQAILIDDEPALLKKAAETISRTTMDVIVQAVAAVNTLPEEQVPVEMKLYLNRLVYHEGDKIADTVVDGRVSEGRILLALTDFWKKQVSASAVKSGIIPASSPDQRTSVGQNPEEQVDELMRAVDRIRAIGGPARVAVYATADIYAADLLQTGNVRFSVTGT